MIVSDSLSDDQIRQKVESAQLADDSPAAAAAWVQAQLDRPVAERQAAYEQADQILKQRLGRSVSLTDHFPNLKA